MSFLGVAQISKQQAIKIVMDSVAGNDSTNVNVYMEPLLKSDSYYKMSQFLTNPGAGFNDSIFAAIDLGDLYLRMEENGEKGICGRLLKYKPKLHIENERKEQFALSLLPKIQDQQNPKDGYYPVKNLIVEVDDHNMIKLLWDFPENSPNQITVSWITSENNVGGSTQAGFDNIFGHLYNISDLRSLSGWKIDTISFYKTTLWTYKICVWRQFLGEPMQLIHSQLVPVNDSLLGNWIAIAVDTTIYIEENANYWFGVRATWEEGQTGSSSPIPFDGGPVVAGKGDLFMPDLTHWTSMHIGYNTMIKTSLNNELKKDRLPTENNILTGYRIYRDGTLIKEIPYSFVTYFTDTEFTRETDVEYCVTAVYGEEESEPVCATATITGVGEAMADDAVTLSPNPTNGIVRIEGATVSEVKVYNALGQLVKTVLNTNEINMKGLSQGIYTFFITDESGLVVAKKVVLK